MRKKLARRRCLSFFVLFFPLLFQSERGESGSHFRASCVATYSLLEKKKEFLLVALSLVLFFPSLSVLSEGVSFRQRRSALEKTEAGKGETQKGRGFLSFLCGTRDRKVVDFSFANPFFSVFPFCLFLDMPEEQPAAPVAARPWAAIVAATSSGGGGDGGSRAASARAASARATTNSAAAGGGSSGSGSSGNNAGAPPSSSSSPGAAKAGGASSGKPAEVRAPPDAVRIEKERDLASRERADWGWGEKEGSPLFFFPCSSTSSKRPVAPPFFNGHFDFGRSCQHLMFLVATLFAPVFRGCWMRP